MRNDTIYLLYNANASDIKVHPGPPVDRDRRSTEYEDKDEFVILYGPSDERKYTDIKVVSKTKLRQRPKSTGDLSAAPGGHVEGILLRRTIGLRGLQDLDVFRRIPKIRPLLSETEITRLQNIQEECKLQRYVGSFGKTNAGVDSHLRWSPYEGGIKLGDDVKSQSPQDGDDIIGTISPRDVEQGRMGNIDGQIHQGRPLDKDKRKLPDRGKQYPDKPGAIDKLRRQPKATDLGIKGKDPTFSRKSKAKPKKEIMQPPMKTLANKAKKSAMEKDNVYSGSKAKPGRKPEHPSANKHDIAGKAKKGKDKPDKNERQPKLTKSNKKKSNRSSKSELSFNFEKFAKYAKSPMSGHEHKQEKKEKDTKSLRSDRDSMPEIKSKEENALKSTKSIKRKQSESPSSKTKGSENTAKSTSSKQQKRATGNAADDRITSGKLEETKGDKSGRTSDIESIISPKSRKLLSGHEGEDKSLSGGKSPVVKDKRGRTKSILTTTGTTPAIKSVESGNMAASSKKKEKLDRPQKKSRAYPSALYYMIKYVLSDPVYMKLGWTLSADDRTLNRVVTFKTTPANPDLYCFKEREEALLKTYASGNVAVNIQTDGSGEILYPSGHPAMVIKTTSHGMRLTMYSDKKQEPSVEHSNKARLIGMFDSFGNGVVYDKLGNKTLHYNQLEGIYNNPLGKTPYKWRWSGYNVVAPQRIRELMNYMAKEHKNPQPVKGKQPVSTASPKRSAADREYEKVLEELPRPVHPKSKKKRHPSSSGFKSIIYKITDNITLRITGQENITIVFSAEKITHRMELGVVIDADTVERIEDLSLDKMEDIPCVFEALKNMSPSLEKLNMEHNPEKKTVIKKRRA